MSYQIHSEEIELSRFDSQNPLISIDSNDDDDTSSVVISSHYSGSSSNVFNSHKEINTTPKNDPIEPSKTFINSLSVVDSTNVLVGTTFKQPVIIKNFYTNGNDFRRSTNGQYNLQTDALETRSEQLSDQRRVYCARKTRWLIISTLASVALVTTIIVAGRYLHAVGVAYDIKQPNHALRALSSTTIDVPSVTNMDDGDYEFVNRKQYEALQSITVNVPLILPIKEVIISHTVTPDCTDYKTCAKRVRQVQEFHMKTFGWDDIGLNFLVGGDGRAYEGCGYTVGAHTYRHNSVSICIAFIGNFSSYEAPQKQLKAAQRIIDDGIKMNKIHPDYVLYGQRQLRNFDSPGVMLYNQIKLWPHWSKEVIPL